MKDHQNTPSRPLAGLKVLELARILAGPWVGQTLADLGADVVKVERRGAGDDTRQWGPPFVPAAGGGDLGAAYFHACNRGKRSIEADFEDATDMARIKALALTADVVVENFKVGGLVKYGLDAASLRAAKPSLIVCSISGFGQDGPYAQRAGYDFLIQGMAGAMSITGTADGQPIKAGYATADIFTGMYAAVAILAALRHRDATGGRESGTGAHIDCALLDSQIAVLGNQAMNYLVSGTPPSRLGNAHPNIVPYEVFPVADGHIIIASGNDGQYQKLCAAIGGEALANNPDYATNKGRVAHRAVLVPAIAALTMRFAMADLLAKLEVAGVPAGPINPIDAVFADPQVIARGMRVDIPSDAASGGTIPGVRTPIVMNGVPMVSPRPAPQLGEHEADVKNDKEWQ
jgi:crotonobetainyl-CoA:carnitine CoA-transferase CaiB-like acyl-CoA transferase